MEARRWLYETVKTALDALAPDWSTHSGGSLDETPANKPFAIVRIGQDFNSAAPGRFTEVTVWLHDDPGSYLNIDSGLEAIRAALHDARPPLSHGSDGIVCEHLGDSSDLSDDGYKTITRYGTYQLVRSNR
jgi:hypothetical protein